MQVDRAVTRAKTRVNPAPTYRRIKHAWPQDRRFADTRRLIEAMQAVAERCGLPFDWLDRELRRCAELQIAAAAARGRIVRGEPVDIGDLVKLENVAHRSLQALLLRARVSAG